MTTCPTCYNTSCPETVPEVNINQTFLVLDSGDAVVDIYSETVTGTTVTLPQTPITGYDPQVFVNGVLQTETTHYTVAGSVITFTFTLSSDDVQVKYAFEV